MSNNQMYRNGEGYFDYTAGKAFQKIEREEVMENKRSRRRTIDKNIIHDKAVLEKHLEVNTGV